MLRNLRARIALAALLLLASVSSHSAFHLWQISEVYSNASGTLQFIELSTTFGGQEVLGGQFISSTQGGNTNTFTFPANLPCNPCNTAGKKFLIGTSGIAAASGVTPDYIIPNGFVFTSNVTINFAGFDSVVFSSIPTNGTLSIDRSNATATNSPTNFAGTSGTVTGSSATAPAAPVIGTAIPSDSQATISFTPGSDGGSPITRFDASCSAIFHSTRTATSLASPIQITGLDNGTTYLCSITATNAVGTGPPASVNVTPIASVTVPGAPTLNFVSAGDGQASADFSPPASNGGAAISNYIFTCGTAQASGPTSPITLTGLTNGTTYSCTVAAVNSAGTGPQSAPRNTTPGTPPGAPTITGVVVASMQGTISFTTPPDGGTPIVNYGVSCNSGQVQMAGPSSPIAVTGLTNGVAYSCTVVAISSFGPGAASAPVVFTPSAPAGAPTITATTPGDGRGSVTFTAPASNGGSAITGYTATCGGISVTSPVSPITVTGLANNVAVDCTVRAINAIGPGAASAIVAVTPSAAAPLTPIAVLARKTHGGSGIFDLPLNLAPGPVTSEPRVIGGGHTIVFQFNLPVSATGMASVTPVGSVSAMISGFDVVVTLTSVADNQRVTVSLTDVNGAGVNVAATIGLLVGDVNNTQSVTAADISGVKARSGQTATGQNFRFDVNATGAVNASDISAVKARAGLVLPP